MSGTSNKFLTDYILCLKERTRKEKGKGIVIGFDWIIYNLALSLDWITVRLPFIRQPKEDTGKTKTEAEFGNDLCFFSNDKTELIIFVLKDEVLNNQNWTKNDFDKDLRMAAAPDLTGHEIKSLNSVRIILAYNKDEDKNGIELYDRLVDTMPSVLKDNISLTFERWNINTIVEMVKQHLFSPDLLPQHLTDLLSYICAQVSDFSFCSKEWENQLIPNWKNFLDILFAGSVDERKLRLVPISLIIIYENRKQTPDSYPGWIDLIEWAMLRLWQVYRETKDKNHKIIIIEIWHTLYIFELEKYIIENSAVFETEHGIQSKYHSSIRLTPINDAFIAYWHLGRIGMLNFAPQGFINFDNSDEKEIFMKWLLRSSRLLISCLRNNPSTMRPLIDLNHIELFLIWLILWQAGRKDEIYAWLSNLETYLLVRRSGQAHLPFIEARNRFDLVVEYATYSKYDDKNKPIGFTETSSYLLLMILELCLSLDSEQRDELLGRYYNRIIKGLGDDGLSFTNTQIDLVGWAPPEDWKDRVLSDAVYDGVGITAGSFFEESDEPFFERVKAYIAESRKQFSFKTPEGIPLAVYVLACIKNKSPLPAEFWRELLLPPES